MSNNNNIIINDVNDNINNKEQEQIATIVPSTVVDLDGEQQKFDIDENELRRLLFKLDIRILPLFSLCQLFFFMDVSILVNMQCYNEKLAKF